MSMPNIPDINPDICLCFEDVINLLLSSVALQEIALSHILTAESEKLKVVIKRYEDCCCSVKDLITVNESIEKVLYEAGTIESLLVTKIKYIKQISDKKHKNECGELEENIDLDCKNIFKDSNAFDKSQPSKFEFKNINSKITKAFNKILGADCNKFL